MLVDPACHAPERFANAAAIVTAGREHRAEPHPRSIAARRAKPQRRERELPVAVAGFDDADGISRTYEPGRAARRAGFRADDPADVTAGYIAP